MLGKCSGIVVLLVINIVATLAVAQDEQKNELGGILGRIFISDQGIKANIVNPTIHSGNGTTFAGEYSRRFIVTPLFSLSGEGLFVWNEDEDINGGSSGFAVVPVQYGEFFLTPAARLNLFPTTAVSPWVSFGAGFGHISQSSTLSFGGANPGKSTTSGVLEAGAGLDVKVWSKLIMRGEVRDFWAGEPDFPLAPTGKTRQHNFFVGGGAYWRF
jgi:opacity protein-like surface antigen